MATSFETIHEELEALRKDVTFIRHILSEDFELSGEAKKGLEEARKTPLKEHISQEEMEKEFLR